MASAQRDAEAKRRRVVVDKHAGRVAAFTVFSPQEWDVGNAVLVPRSPGVRVSPAAAEGHKLGLGRTNASRDASVDHGAAVHTGECAGAAPPAVAQHYAETRCNAVQASVPRGFWLARKVCDSGTAAVIYDALGSAEAEAKAWTGLKLDNKSDKTYTGTADGLLMRDARYAKVWGRRKIRKMGLLEECHELTTVRRRIETLIGEIVGAELAGCVLLTEQLIKYTTDDLFFNLHWDIDTEDPSAPLEGLGSIEPSEFGPGAAIATLNLGCRCHVLLKPRVGDDPSSRRSVELAPGDVYVMAGDARWRWLHGVSVPADQPIARRAVVWRFQTPQPTLNRFGVD
eukprot:m.16008 g.16008  ORF g.16008 m.16008 type:complete len:341 (+) comp8892_c0_seq1:118-1140(+)